MTTQQAIDRWTKVLDEILIPMTPVMRLMQPIERFPAPEEQAPGAIKTATDALLSAWNTDPPPTGTPLHELLAPAVDAARALDPRDGRLAPIREYLDLLRVVRDQIQTLDTSDVLTIDEVLLDMELELKLSILVARLGHQGIMNLIHQRRSDYGRSVTKVVDLPDYLDLHTMEPTDESSATTLSYSAILAKADPGILTPEEFVRGDDRADKAPILKRFAGQWIVSFYTEWEDLFRKQLAEICGCSVDDIKSQFFQELGRMRNDFGHGRGICKKSASNKLFRWFAKGDPIIPTHENYRQLFDEFEKACEALRTPPAPQDAVVQRQPVRAKVTPELNAEFDRAVAASHGITADEALTDALRTWIDRNAPA
ncbi:hypothetical protein QSJ18_19825 [Gordonia sp. ABSL1-1]|uniref:hypothetical protein n=1 Tax=Gordonia sp. ABSL1-1 TaxID=3053923 RepID=UPI002573E53C|nr:hypothetical protein [Gordonia sp. ABSL1-1]MDL9939001.1 hypothetical protein [Gordonia sp. ABSL1-1]